MGSFPPGNDVSVHEGTSRMSGRTLQIAKEEAEVGWKWKWLGVTVS